MKFGDITHVDKQILKKTICEAASICENPVFVEVGINKARTSQAIMKSLDLLRVKSKLICVDKSLYAQKSWKTKCQDRVGFCTSEFVLSDSWSFTPKEKNLAWVFIDACHCYECVKKDIEHWAPLVMSGGFLLFHDAAKSMMTRRNPKAYHNDNITRSVDVYKALEDWDCKDFIFYGKSDAILDKRNRWKGSTNVYQKDYVSTHLDHSPLLP